jgi:chloride channel protein, CIC family
MLYLKIKKYIAKLLAILNYSILFIKYKLSHRQFIFIASILVGISAGLAAVILKQLLHFIFILINDNTIVHSYVYYAILPITGILLSILITNYLFRKKKMFKGLTGLLTIIHKRSSIVPRIHMYSQVITSSLTVGFGGSAGVEAPIVITGAAYGSNFARTYKLSHKDRTLLLACGVAAGIGGAFNAPIAGVLFTLEVLTLDVTITAFIPLIIAAASGTLISKIFLGQDVLLSFHSTQAFNYKNLPLYIILGVLAGLLSVYHTRIFHWIEQKMNLLKVNKIQKGLIGGSFLALLIFLFPSLYGEGYESIKWLASGNEIKLLNNSILKPFFMNEWVFILFLLMMILFKPIATGLTLGSGGNGGNFAPSLFMGAYLGFLISHITNLTFDFKIPVGNFTLVGMAGILSGLYHAPLTAIFLIAEITGGYDLMIPLMIVSSISFAISKYFEPFSMDTKKIAESGEIISSNKDEQVLSSIHIETLIDKDFQTILPNQNLGEIVECIKNSSKNIFPVVSENHSFLGVILIENIKEVMFNNALYSKITARELMTIPKQIVTKDQNLETILKFMEVNDYWFVPVVFENEFKGFISKNKILTNYRMRLKNEILE